jgi:hypothetical protein
MAKPNTSTTPLRALRNGVTRAKKWIAHGEIDKALTALEAGEASAREIEAQHLAKAAETKPKPVLKPKPVFKATPVTQAQPSPTARTR